MKKLVLAILLGLMLLIPGANARENADNKTLIIDGQKVTVSVWYNRWHEINSNKYYTVGTDLKTGWWHVKNIDDNGNLTSKNLYDWYYFDQTGKMLKDVIVDGYIIGSDGTGVDADHNDLTIGQKGQIAKTTIPIVAGWNYVSGKWYYFNKDLAILKNTVTPDGYKVGLDGAWI